MDKEIVIIVATEGAAYGVVRALQDLDREGAIELYATQVVTRAENGAISVLDQREERAPVGAIGAASGALIGLLAGPAGAALGAVMGGSLGLAADAGYYGLTGDFINDTAQHLVPGTFAVCASVWEDWMAPIDAAVAPFQGIVLRQAAERVAAAQLEAEEQGLKDEWAHYEAEVEQATGDAKKQLEAQRASLVAKQAAQREALKKRATALQAQWDAKMQTMDDKAASKSAEAKARHQRHHDKLAQFAQRQREAFTNLFA